MSMKMQIASVVKNRTLTLMQRCYKMPFYSGVCFI